MVIDCIPFFNEICKPNDRNTRIKIRLFTIKGDFSDISELLHAYVLRFGRIDAIILMFVM